MMHIGYQLVTKFQFQLGQFHLRHIATKYTALILKHVTSQIVNTASIAK